MNPPPDLPLLPEYRDNLFINRLPPQMSTRQAMAFLKDPPTFTPEERRFPAHERLQCLYRLRRCFVPLEHHLQLQSAFSALVRQGYVNRNPINTDYIRRLRDGNKRIIARNLQAGKNPVRSSAEGFALLGASGAGKSTGMARILEYYPQVIEHSESFKLKQVVWLKVDCPHQGSPKQLCVNFFQQMDLVLETNNLARYGNSKNSLDLMMTQMAQVANLHALGVLIVDEIQHLSLARGVGPEALLNFLVTLINTIGIPVVLIGTMGALSFLQGDFRQARRANGLGAAVWERLPQGPVWDHFVNELWPYQWTREESTLTDDIRQVLYEESQGIIDVVVKLFILGQLRAIELGVTLKQPEIMDAELFRKVASDHFKIIAPMIRALKSGNRHKIDKYSDLRPLDEHIQQALQAAQVSVEPEVLDVQAPCNVSTSTEVDTETLVKKLKELGLAEDIAQRMAVKAHGEHPGASLLELVGLISAKLYERAPEPKPPSPPYKEKATPKIPANSQLEKTVAAGRQHKQSAHASLREAGLISPPLRDIDG
jgi:hypothetical protein